MNNRGFMALMIVMMMGVLSSLIVLSAASETYLHSRNVAMVKRSADLRLNALSCVEIAKTKYFSGYEQMEGEYYVGDGVCKVDIFSQNGTQIFVLVSGQDSNVRYETNAKIDTNTGKILFLDLYRK